MLAAGDHRRARALGRQQRAGGAVAEQRGRDDVAFCPIVAAKRQSAQFDDEKQHNLPGLRRAWLAARASPITPPAQPSPKIGNRLTSRRNPIRSINSASRLGVAMPVVDTVTTASIARLPMPALVEQPDGRRFEQVERSRDVDPVALGPAVLAIVPFDRHPRIARADAGIGKDRQQPLEARRSPNNASTRRITSP